MPMNAFILWATHFFVLDLTANTACRVNARALIDIATEQFWRLRAWDAGGRYYEPQAAAVLKKHHLTLPFTVLGT